jgi:7-keto-8-aminopelargonate synthetase-like enzyme
MSAVIMILAQQAAIKAVKREFQAQGLKPTHIEHKTIVAAANDYLRDHPELIEQAAETVRKDYSKPNTAPTAQLRV